MPTDPRWADLAKVSLEEILTDHAFCEQKAATQCISLIQLYPGKEALVNALSPIVTEEWGHFRMVWAEMKKSYEEDKNKPRRTEKEKNDWKLSLLDYKEPHIALSSLHAISCPSLIICGDHDMISIEHTTQIFQNIPHAALWVVPQSGHATLIEHRDEFNRLVDNFFSTTPQVKK